MTFSPPGERALDVLGVGECMVEFFADGPLGQARTLTRAYGGDVLNALVAATRLGSRTAFITRVGDDPFGPALLAAWQEEGVDTTHAPLVPGENGVYFISLLDGGEREFTYRRGGSAASRLSPDDLEPSHIASSRCVLLSGITQAISESARAATLAAARLARGSGTLVAYDPNYRPRLWEGQGGSDAARAAFLELAPLIDVLLPSHPVDTELLAGRPLEPEQAMRFLQSLAPVLAMKAGGGGAWLSVAGAVEHAPAVTTAVVDATGAGDAWNGAFLHAITGGKTPSCAVVLANVTAAATLAHRGAVARSNGGIRMRPG